MQTLPAFASKSAHHAVGRSRGEHGQTEQRHKAKGQTDSMHDFTRDFAPIEHQVGTIKSQMHRRVGKGTDPDHPAHVQKLVKAQDSAQRPHRESDEQEYQCPISGAMDQIGDRSWVEPYRVEIVNRLTERREQAYQRNDTERRYAVTGVAPNFERVSHRISAPSVASRDTHGIVHQVEQGPQCRLDSWTIREMSLRMRPRSASSWSSS